MVFRKNKHTFKIQTFLIFAEKISKTKFEYGIAKINQHYARSKAMYSFPNTRYLFKKT